MRKSEHSAAETMPLSLCVTTASVLNRISRSRYLRSLNDCTHLTAIRGLASDLRSSIEALPEWAGRCEFSLHWARAALLRSRYLQREQRIRSRSVKAHQRHIGGR